MQRIPESPPKIEPVPPGIERPLWSVMIPCYNCSVYLPQAIESVLRQDPGKELMQIEVIDDFSTDVDVEALVNAVGGGRVAYYRQPQNVGSLRNFETCLNRSRGKYVHLLHGDDAVDLGFYETIQNLFDSNPEAGAAFTNFSYIDEESVKLSMTNQSITDQPGILQGFLYKIARRQLIQPPAIVVKREVYEKVGSFFAAHFGEDWEMWSRIASRYPIAYSPKRMAYYRVANSSSISQQSFLSGQNIEDISKIINIIQGYLPPEKREEIKKFALAYYSIYCVKIANGLLSTNREAAFVQARGAFKMYKNLRTLYWLIRFYLMHIIRYKEIQKVGSSIRRKFVPPPHYEV